MGSIDWDRVPVSLVRYDARGHGESDTTTELAPFGWDELARDQLALASALHLETYVVGGASMGAGTALHVATLAPERIRALLLVIPPTAWETRAAQADSWFAAADVVERDGVEGFVRARAAAPIPDPYAGDPTRKERQAASIRSWDPHRLANILRGASVADFPSRALVADIRLPTMILAWTGDPVHPAAVSEELAALIPGARLHVASTADDLASWTDRVDEFVREVVPA
jgi:pimeloyl-ACP methyl ester carboxylesterase